MPSLDRAEGIAVAALSGWEAAVRPASAALWLLAALAGVGPASAHAETLRLGLPISLDSPAGLNIREFARQVQARTSGAISIDLRGR
jgi:TRAP-type C4-dicarboxylate transport system substrate-binding protein